MTEERSRQSRGTPPGRERTQPLDKAAAHASGRPLPSKRPAAREERPSLHCEVDGLPAELERSELSGAGAFVLATQPVSVDSEVSLFLRIGEQRFEMTGHVVQSVSCEQAAKAGKKPGYALLFTNLPDGERKRLSAAIQSARISLRPRAAPGTKVPLPLRASPPPRVMAQQPRASLSARASASGSPAQPAPKPAAPTYAATELTLLQQLKQELLQLDDKPAWAVLGVSQGSEAPQLKAAFFQASKRYHPHLFARYTHPEIKRVVTELFIAHKRAFTTMSKLNKKHT